MGQVPCQLPCGTSSSVYFRHGTRDIGDLVCFALQNRQCREGIICRIQVEQRGDVWESALAIRCTMIVCGQSGCLHGMGRRKKFGWGQNTEIATGSICLSASWIYQLLGWWVTGLCGRLGQRRVQDDIAY